MTIDQIDLSHAFVAACAPSDETPCIHTHTASGCLSDEFLHALVEPRPVTHLIYRGDESQLKKCADALESAGSIVILWTRNGLDWEHVAYRHLQ